MTAIMSSARKPLLRWSVLLAMLSLAACRTTVPAPTNPISVDRQVSMRYTMHQIGPQRVMDSHAVCLADMGNGHTDLIIGGWHKDWGFRVEWGDGHGHWVSENGPPTRMKPRFISVGDINRDGHPDVLIGGEGDQKGLQIWTQPVRGGAWHRLASPTDTGVYYDAKVVDVNEDGWPDIVAVRLDGRSTGGIYVWLNDGHGGWFASVGPVATGLYTGVAVADVNGDGHVDIVASRRGGMGSIKGRDGWREVGGVEVWKGDGTGRWVLESLPTRGDAESVTVGDVDGDGRMDIVAGMYQRGIRVWFGTKSGWARYAVTDQGTWKSVRVGDLHGQGQRDIVAASADDNGIGVWHWGKPKHLVGHRHFRASRGLVPASGDYTSVSLGDVFGRGRLDIAAARADGTVQVWSDLRASPQPLVDTQGEQVGQSQSVFFTPGSAHLSAEGTAELQSWLESLPSFNDSMVFHLAGRPDTHPVHSELYPDNAALSRSRAEAVAAWLETKGIQPGQIQTVAEATVPAQPGRGVLVNDESRVMVSAFDQSRVRMLGRIKGQVTHDLFHVSENAVFKTIKGTPEYKVGAGDLLSITLWTAGKPADNSVTVQDDGTVSLPNLPSVDVDGLTPTEIKGKLMALLAKYVRHPRVDVVVKQALSKSVTIFGQVASPRTDTGPGIYHLKGKESLVNFLSRAGGPTKDSDLSKVQLIRNGQTIVLDLDRAIRHGDWSENAILNDGDTIFVPSLAQSERRVYVLGEVNKPGIVQFSGGIDFLDAIEKSGGFKGAAYLNDIRVVRQNRDHPQIIPVAFNRFMQKGDLTQNVALQDKDVIIVPGSAISNWNNYVKDITPSLSLMLQPMNAYSRWLSIKELQKIVLGTSASTTAVTVP